MYESDGLKFSSHVRLCRNHLPSAPDPCFFMSTHNAKLWKTLNNLLSVLLWNLSRLPVRLSIKLGQILRAVLPLFEATHLLLTESIIAMVIKRPQVLKEIPTVANSFEGYSNKPGKFIRLTIDRDITLYQYQHNKRKHWTVVRVHLDIFGLKVNTSELSALTAFWQIESITTSIYPA